jgi:hypothetical protein
MFSKPIHDDNYIEKFAENYTEKSKLCDVVLESLNSLKCVYGFDDNDIVDMILFERSSGSNIFQIIFRYSEISFTNLLDTLSSKFNLNNGNMERILSSLNFEGNSAFHFAVWKLETIDCEWDDFFESIVLLKLKFEFKAEQIINLIISKNDRGNTVIHYIMYNDPNPVEVLIRLLSKLKNLFNPDVDCKFVGNLLTMSNNKSISPLHLIMTKIELQFEELFDYLKAEYSVDMSVIRDWLFSEDHLNLLITRIVENHRDEGIFQIIKKIFDYFFEGVNFDDLCLVMKAVNIVVSHYINRREFENYNSEKTIEILIYFKNRFKLDSNAFMEVLLNQFGEPNLIHNIVMFNKTVENSYFDIVQEIHKTLLPDVEDISKIFTIKGYKKMNLLYFILLLSPDETQMIDILLEAFEYFKNLKLSKEAFREIFESKSDEKTILALVVSKCSTESDIQKVFSSIMNQIKKNCHYNSQELYEMLSDGNFDEENLIQIAVRIEPTVSNLTNIVSALNVDVNIDNELIMRLLRSKAPDNLNAIEYIMCHNIINIDRTWQENLKTVLTILKENCDNYSLLFDMLFSENIIKTILRVNMRKLKYLTMDFIKLIPNNLDDSQQLVYEVLSKKYSDLKFSVFQYVIFSSEDCSKTLINFLIWLKTELNFSTEFIQKLLFGSNINVVHCTILTDHRPVIARQSSIYSNPDEDEDIYKILESKIPGIKMYNDDSEEDLYDDFTLQNK